jgi:hypothetical protein
MERIGDGDVRWSVVSLDSGHTDRGTSELHGSTHGPGGRTGEPISTDPVGAEAALDRITIPREVLDIGSHCRNSLTAIFADRL